MLKRDSIWLGMLLGVVLPAAVYLALYIIGLYIDSASLVAPLFNGNKTALISLVINLVTLRIYFINLRMEKTGRGILLATFILGSAIFIFSKYL